MMPSYAMDEGVLRYTVLPPPSLPPDSIFIILASLLADTTTDYITTYSGDTTANSSTSVAPSRVSLAPPPLPPLLSLPS